MSKAYVSKLSIGTVFKSKINKAQIWSFNPENAITQADFLMYFNMLGIIILLIHSICLRKQLVKMAHSLDERQVSPSDFALLVRNIPKDMTKEKLKELVESRFSTGTVKVAYINLCYDIQDMVKLNGIITELVKQKGFYKLQVKKQMKEQGL